MDLEEMDADAIISSGSSSFSAAAVMVLEVHMDVDADANFCSKLTKGCHQQVAPFLFNNILAFHQKISDLKLKTVGDFLRLKYLSKT